jgi:AbrB family looped-hinge helix DNA binding protein
MGGTHHVVVGNRGRIVLPAAVRQRAGLSEGSPLILIEAPDGLILLTREQLKARVRAELAGLDLIQELLSERRTQAENEDAA